MTSPRFTITLPDNLYSLLVKDAKRRGQSYAAIIRDAVAQYYAAELDELEKQEPPQKRDKSAKGPR